jgi:hypothetical protein
MPTDVSYLRNRFIAVKSESDRTTFCQVVNDENRLGKRYSW